MTGIGTSAFWGCTSPTSVTLPEGVTEIVNSAFKECTNLTSVSLPASLQKINSFAFWRCAYIANIYYSGTEEQWRNIDIGRLNDELWSATIHYNS